MSKVCASVNMVVDFVIITPPVSDLEFIVRIHDRRVKEVDIPRLVRCPGVTFPEISMYQTGLHHTTVLGEVIQQVWNDMRKKALLKHSQGGPTSILCVIQLNDIAEKVAEEKRPVALPSYGLGIPTLTCCDVEAKFTRRGYACPMQLCELGAKLIRLWWTVRHVNEFRYEKVRLRRRCRELAPS